MIMNMRSWGIYQIRDVCLLFMVVAITRVKDVEAQSSTLDGPSWVDKDGNAIFTCTPIGGGTLRGVEWRNSSLEETSDINNADTIIQYIVGSAPVNRDPSHYAFDSTDPGNPMTVQSVTLDDESTYWCRLNIQGTGDVDKNTQMRVRVPVDNTTMYMSYNGSTYTGNEGNIDILGGTKDVPFNCTAPGIKPGATVFVWTLDGSPVPSTGPPTQSPNGTNDKLTDSTSTVILDIPDDVTKPLGLCCATTNRQDGSSETEASICVTLNLIQCGAGSILYRLDVILACLALAAVYMFNHGI
ncbi:uncharacterized protein LOC119736032 [Patiria miniata]|uniref:Ig-like domain-containing protein n=1 Tax=Patiria miniata TaxID=46514 RepID=A0A914AQM6_PATMI|nr:uncharacterized protein LOC119736032 [Patiria miniata]